MALFLLFFALLSIAETCTPGGEPAYFALFMEETYISPNEAFYKQSAETLLKDALAKKGVKYDPSWFTISARPSYSKVVIDVYLNGVADCKTLPDFVKEMIEPNFLVTGAGIRCGSNPNIIYINKYTRKGENSHKKSI
ncbi:hypothetical protein Y032_0008g95 [Ancylostoma ceylanicum]|uniref:SEA domain-containing protein n=1 Tax=Ancylostoma ceylanicum TaxID=53326 RepID=A0A016VMR0_9BILA|nr:hypothetical protein Y032_0008g95 [Ancylostoma ceylanicum]